MLFNCPYRRRHVTITQYSYFIFWHDLNGYSLQIAIYPHHCETFDGLTTPQVPSICSTWRSDFLSLAAHSHRANTATSKRGSCAGKFFFGPPWFQSGWPGSVGFVGIFHSIRQVFSWNITIGYNESGICWFKQTQSLGSLYKLSHAYFSF